MQEEQTNVVGANNLSLTTQKDLLSKLRDRLVEVTQRGQSGSGNSGLCVSLGNVEELSLAVSAIRLVWNGSCRRQMILMGASSSTTMKSSGIGRLEEEERIVQWKKLRSLGCSIQNLFLESLPIRDDSGNQSNVQWYDYLNASVCCAISEFGSTLAISAPSSSSIRINGGSTTTTTTAEDQSQSTWVTAIFTYLLPRLENDTPPTDTESSLSKPSSSSSSSNKNNSNTRVTLLKVISHLLVRDKLNSTTHTTKHQLSSCPLEDHPKRMQLLQKFSDAFFGCEPVASVGGDAEPTNTDADNKESGDDTFMPVCNSAEGRKAAALLVTLITQHLLIRSTTRENDDDDDDDATSDDSDWLDTWALLTKMASVLPLFLKSWRGAFPKLSSTILATLLSITRQSTLPDSIISESAVNRKDDNDNDTDNDGSSFESITNQLCTSLRESICGLFVLSGKKKIFIADDNNTKVYKYRVSVFEQLSEMAQRLTMGIVGMLRHPSDALLLSLSQICVHKRCKSKGSSISATEERTVSGLSDGMVDYIMSIVHSIRRTMSLQVYLTFLVNSTGINGAQYRVKNGTVKVVSKGSADVSVGVSEGGLGSRALTPNDCEGLGGAFDIAFVTSYDKAIARSCRYLLQCGGAKILHMLSPVLSSWLGDNPSQTSCKEEYGTFMIAMLKIRATLCIISCFALDEVSDLSDDMDRALVDAVCNLMLSIPLARVMNSDETMKATFLKILAPLVALLSCRSSTLCNILKECGKRIESKKFDIQLNESLINSILALVKSNQLRAALRISDVAQTLKDTSTCIENVSSDGPLDMLGGMLRTEVQSLLGFSF